jgi:hypothetical protein
MYSKKSWGGAVDPFILVTFVKEENAGDSTVSLVIFEYEDKKLLGRPIGDDPNEVRGQIATRKGGPLAFLRQSLRNPSTPRDRSYIAA